jgi:tetratricopeptide (TPR) repeat protein
VHGANYREIDYWRTLASHQYGEELMKMLLLPVVLCVSHSAAAQGRNMGGPMQQAAYADLHGHPKDAQIILQAVIDTSKNPYEKATVQRALAMSYAFDGDCPNAVKYETMVIDYWRTREVAEPLNAFYQEGEMANEAARVCIDAGDLDVAERWYKQGSEFGLREPEPKTHSKALWDYRLAHALGRLAARRGKAAEARRQIDVARKLLDSDSTLKAQQERFFPYLVGYVALHTGDLATAERELGVAVDMQGNQNDPFMRYLLGLTYEKQGRSPESKAAYARALSLATGHNPPSAFVHHTLSH